MYLPSFAMLKTALLVALVCGGGLGFAALLAEVAA